MREGVFLVIFETNVLRFDVWFAFEELVVAKFERSGVNWEGFIESHEDIIAAWNGWNGAKNDGFLTVFSDASASVMRKEAFARGKDAAVVADEVADNWRNNTVMHVAGDEKVEFIEITDDFGVFEEDWRVDEGDFGFIFR